MAGQIKCMIDALIEQRAKGDPLIRIMTKSKLLLRGVDPDRFNRNSADDPQVVATIRAIAAELGTSLELGEEKG